MKHSYSLLLCLLLASLMGRASNFCPLQPGALHQFTKAQGDTTYGVRLQKPGYRLGTDSVYVFTPRIGRNTRSSPANCYNAGFRLNDALFGAKLIVTNPGTFQAEYIFADLHDWNWFVLKPRAPLNQPWDACDSPAYFITAQVTARGTALVLGQPDSVVTIALSSGQTIRLSKNYGLVDGPAPYDFVRGVRTVHSLVLTALPTRHLGTPLLSNQAIYDFQPGDVFCYQYSNLNIAPGAPNNIQYSYGDSVISRTNSRSGDTITYRIWRYFPGAGGPNRTYTLVIDNTTNPLLAGPTNTYAPNAGNGDGIWVRDMARSPDWPTGRPMLFLHDRHRRCGPPSGYADSLIMTPLIDTGRKMGYGIGLGQVVSREENWLCCSITTLLLGYRKGSEQWGTVFRLGRILGTTPAATATALIATPNPFRDELTVTLNLSRAQPVALRLLNSLGQVVLDAGSQSRAAGKQQLVVATAALPAGMYTVLIQPTQGRAEHLKVLKL
jgi:hypothetical protein